MKGIKKSCIDSAYSYDILRESKQMAFIFRSKNTKLVCPKDPPKRLFTRHKSIYFSHQNSYADLVYLSSRWQTIQNFAIYQRKMLILHDSFISIPKQQIYFGTHYNLYENRICDKFTRPKNLILVIYAPLRTLTTQSICQWSDLHLDGCPFSWSQ